MISQDGGSLLTLTDQRTGERVQIKESDFENIAGRAGRPFQETEGRVVLVPDSLVTASATASGKRYLLSGAEALRAISQLEGLARAIDHTRTYQLVDAEIAQRVRDGLQSVDGLLTHLRSNGVTADQLRKCARRCEDEENENRINVQPGNPSLAFIQGQLRGKKVHRVSDVLHRLADELSCGREGESYSLRKIFDDRLKAQGRQKFPLAHMPGIVMDATASELVLRQFMPSLVVAADIQVERKAFITQISDQTFNRTLYHPDTHEVRDKVRQYVEAVSKMVHSRTKGGRTLVTAF